MEAKATPPPAPLPLWWVSYCDTSKPEGEHFVGVIVIRAADVQGAFHEASKIDGVPTEGCLHKCHCHHHIDVAFVESDRSQEFRIEDLQGRFVPRDEVLAMPRIMTADEYREYGDE